MKKFTVIGGNGFIGSQAVQQLNSEGHEVWIPEKGEKKIFEEDLGTVIYCAGCGDCEKLPFVVLQANLTLLAEILERANFSRLIYVSSTRLYLDSFDSSENSDLTILHDDKRRLFNLTKITAEEMCLRSNKDTVIARLSNVYGTTLNSKLFLPSIIRDAINVTNIKMYVSKTYSKDYVSVNDVAILLSQMGRKIHLKSKIYNIASGVNISSGELAKVISNKTGCLVHWLPSIPDDTFPVIDISNIRDEFPDFEPSSVLDDIEGMIEDYVEKIKGK